MIYEEGYQAILSSGKKVKLVKLAGDCKKCDVGDQPCPRTESGRLVCVAASSPGVTMIFKHIGK